ncbi:hypothetical protein [Paucisalibacillus globulus]|uniref:hypothetical protein n=1 Tax=Paucisalibacillus globulus TaxID=351095 RepID=UPI0004285660|nr:hypothetical protein [Paucisalibacillus globulus]
MLKKLLTAIISTLLFGALMGFMNYMTMPEGMSQGFWKTMFFFAIYAAPVYLIAGIPISYLIDKLMKKVNSSSELARHYAKYGLYILVGILAAVIYKVILFIVEDIPFFSYDLATYIVGGVIASLIFYYVSLVFDKKESK